MKLRLNLTLEDCTLIPSKDQQMQDIVCYCLIVYADFSVAGGEGGLNGHAGKPLRRLFAPKDCNTSS